jgi:PIN domain nuclease of toxin-antitoxin system
MVLDTHVALWHLLGTRRLSRPALQAIERTVRSGKPLWVSAVSIVETIYLVELGRVPLDAFQKLDAEFKDPAFGLHLVPIDEHVAAAVRDIPRGLVPEMGDRIIAATALYLNVPLITRDARIQASGIRTIW